ncbi:hypothetical protein Hanom_Chr06g00565391 [Helianthus anomalus]
MIKCLLFLFGSGNIINIIIRNMMTFCYVLIDLPTPPIALLQICFDSIPLINAYSHCFLCFRGFFF